MNMTPRLTLLVIHLVLLVLASTCFTVVTGLGDGIFQCEYLRYAAQGGFGVPYQYPYSLPVVLTYIAAYALGVFVYWRLYRSGSWIMGLIGMSFCILGFLSFGFELTHWFQNHYGSSIASAPIVLFVLGLTNVLQQSWHRHVEPATSESL